MRSAPTPEPTADTAWLVPDEGTRHYLPFAGLRDVRFRIMFAAGAGLWLLGVLASFLATGPDLPRLMLGVAGWAVYPLATAAVFRTTETPRLFEGRTGIGIVVGLTALAIVLVLVLRIGAFLQLFFFPAFAAARLRPDRLAISGIAAVAVASAVTGLIARATTGVAVGLGLAQFFVAFTLYSVSLLQRTNRALQEARHDLARLAVAEERNRFARDLHDTLGHELTLMALKSELAGRLVETDPSRARSEMADVAEAARGSLASVRDMVSGTYQPSIEHELTAATTALAAAGISSDVDGASLHLDAPASVILGWALREGVTNVIRHSGARSVRIALAARDGAVHLELSDDGRGPAENEPAVAQQGGFGLRGLAERVHLAGGQLEFGPVSPHGFRLRVVLPAGSSPA